MRSSRPHVPLWQCSLTVSIALALAACGSVPKAPVVPAEPVARKPTPPVASSAPYLPPAGSGRGGYYKDDGPGENIPPGLEQTPDPEPKVEPYSRTGNKPYVVFGKTYVPVTDNTPLVQRGVGSWYGKKFHGQKTSSGEPYDMYKMTAAHPTLPIPSYARITNLSNGKQVIVRVNDRGPFHSSRIIDLSYTAALKLGYLGKGSGQLQVERLLPEEIERLAQNRGNTSASAAQADAAVPVLAAAGYSAPAEPAPAVQTAAVSLPVAAVQTLAEPAPARPAAELAGQPEMKQARLDTSAPASTQMPPAFYLQLGAFSQSDNADAMRSRLAQEWGGKLPPFEVVRNGVHYRLFSGPFSSRASAAEAAQQMQDSGGAKPMIVQR